MSVLKIKDEQGNWTGIHTIEGPAGPQGEPGPQGPQGPKGEDGIQDVKINGTSIVSDNVANIPNLLRLDENGQLTVVDAPSSTKWTGQVGIDTNGQLKVATVTESIIDSRGSGSGQFIPAKLLDYSVKKALTDGKGTAYTATEKAAACERLGVTEKVEPIADKLDALWKLSEGRVYDIVEQEENGVINPPSGAKYATVEDVRGNTTQESTNGYQLLNLTERDYTSHNVTAHVEGGIVYITGNANNNGFNNTIGTYTVIESGTYTLATNSSEDNDNARIIFSVNSGGLQTAYPKATISLNAGDVLYINVRCSVVKEYNQTLMPMLEKGSTAHPWEPYTGGVASPNPEYPQEIVSVESFTVRHADADGNTIAERTITPPRPLNRIGDYFDKADIENGVWSICTAPLFIDGVNIKITYMSASTGKFMITSSTDITAIPGIGFAERHIINGGGVGSVTTNQHLSLENTTQIIQMWIIIDGISNIQEANEYLKQHTENIVCARKEKAEEPINASDLEFLRSLENLPASDNIIITDNHGRDVSYLVEYIRKLSEVS